MELSSESNTPAGRPGFRLGLMLMIGLLILSLGLLIAEGLRIRRVIDTDRARMAAFIDEVESRMAAVPLLTDRESALLRRSLNRRHVALGEALGIEPVTDRTSIDSIRGQLVDLTSRDSLYQSSAARYSVPLGTPDLAYALDSLALAFRARLDAAGLPHARFALTSTLRTTADQSALRAVNGNAARGRSSHEFGTTTDIHSRRFSLAGPGPLRVPRASPDLPGPIRASTTQRLHRDVDTALEHLVEAYPSRYQAILGRTLIDLEDAGVLVTVLERRQPVFHTTVARRFPADDSTATP